MSNLNKKIDALEEVNSKLNEELKAIYFRQKIEGIVMGSFIMLCILGVPASYWGIRVMNNVNGTIAGESIRVQKELDESYQFSCLKPTSEMDNKKIKFILSEVDNAELYKAVKADKSLGNKGGVYEKAREIIENEEAVEMLCAEADEEKKNYKAPEPWVYFKANWKEVLFK